MPRTARSSGHASCSRRIEAANSCILRPRRCNSRHTILPPGVELGRQHNQTDRTERAASRRQRLLRRLSRMLGRRRLARSSANSSWNQKAARPGVPHHCRMSPPFGGARTILSAHSGGLRQEVFDRLLGDLIVPRWQIVSHRCRAGPEGHGNGGKGEKLWKSHSLHLRSPCSGRFRHRCRIIATHRRWLMLASVWT